MVRFVLRSKYRAKFLELVIPWDLPSIVIFLLLTDTTPIPDELISFLRTIVLSVVAESMAFLVLWHFAH